MAGETLFGQFLSIVAAIKEKTLCQVWMIYRQSRLNK